MKTLSVKNKESKRSLKNLPKDYLALSLYNIYYVVISILSKIFIANINRHTRLLFSTVFALLN